MARELGYRGRPRLIPEAAGTGLARTVTRVPSGVNPNMVSAFA